MTQLSQELTKNDSLYYLNKAVEVIMDRPLGSSNPKHGFRYDANYGYVPETLSADGEELDAYVLGVNTPLEKFSGKCVAVIRRTNDNDDKLVVIPNDMENISDEEIRKATDFQEKFFQSVILREAPR